VKDFVDSLTDAEAAEVVAVTRDGIAGFLDR
jgi:hypothetical protein